MSRRLVLSTFEELFKMLLPSVDFAEGGKPEYPEKNPRSQIGIDKSQLTCGVRESMRGFEVRGATDDSYANLTPC